LIKSYEKLKDKDIDEKVKNSLIVGAHLFRGSSA
jgi:hypothetical protein